MQTIIVDMTPGYRMPTIYFSQGDVGTQFAIDLRSRFGDSLPASPTVTIQATKPSGFGFTVAATSLTNGVAVFTTTAEMTDEAGRFPAELKVVKDNVTLFSANFGMEGEANTHPAGTIDGSQETVIPELTQLVERAEDAASSVLDRQTVTNTLPAGSQATYSFDEGTNTQTFGIPQGEAGAGAAGVVASAYSSSNTYAVGDYVIHNSNLYRCTTAITTAESFTAAHWTQVVLADDVSDVKSDIDGNIEPRLYVIDGGNEPSWEIGNVGIATSGWDYNATPSTKRIRTPKGKEIFLPQGTRVGLTSYTNMRYYCGIRKSDGTYAVNDGNSSNWQSADISLPASGYCIFMIRNDPEVEVTDVTDLSDCFTYEKPTSDRSFMETSEEYFTAIEREKPLVSFSNNCISDIGIVTAHAGYRTSDLFELKSGETFYLKAKGETVISAIYRYSKDGSKRIDGIARYTQTGYDTFTYTASEKVEYIRFCYLNSAQVDYWIYKVSKGTPNGITNRNTTTNDYYKLIFDKVLCVGDSLTVGWYSDVYGAVAGKNYPAFLAQMTGWECTNAGHNGYTTKQYWEGNFLPTYDLTTYDAVIIFLGTNGGFTDTLDEDTASTPYADTNTGDYCKIIEYIEGQNANIKIFMVIPPLFNETENYGNAKEVLEEIAEKYTLPVIDLTSHDNHFIANRNNGILHPNSDNVHYGKVGYMQIADNIRSAIMDIIADNPLAYEYPY